MNYFLGIDMGTTSAKAVAFDQKGTLLGNYSISYEMQHPKPGYAEQSVAQILDAVVLAIKQATEALQPLEAAFVSFSSMMHSLIVVDEDGQPVTNCIIWADNRAAAVAESLRDTGEAENLYRTTGVPVHAMSPFCKLLWMKTVQPEVYQRAHKFIGIKEYVFYKIFGEYVVDTAIASATGLLNMHSLQWDSPILQRLELTEEKLSTVVAVESIFTYYQNRSGLKLPNLKDGTPVIIGGSDGSLANLGTGSTADNSMAVTIGTSAAIRILTSAPVTEDDMSVFCYHALGRQYIIGGASNNGAIVLQWLKESLLQTGETYDQLFALAEGVPAGSTGLLLVPYILGERAPVWNSEARGIYFGLTINHTKAHLVRAAMEGVIYNLYSIGRQLQKRTGVKEIYAAGGFAKSSLWLQMLADVFNCRVLVSGSPESSALGAVMVGMKALRLEDKIQPVIVSVHEPIAGNHETYQEQHQKFERIYKALKSELNPVVHPAAPPVE
jgi:gluconokinase